MLKLIKKFFAGEKEVVIEEIGAELLQEWLEKKVSTLEFNNYLQGYFKRISDLKTQLGEKVETLKSQEISEKEHKQVEDRVKNIVIGHKNHYVLEIERFTESLFVTEKEKFSTISDYQNILSFNKNLDKELEELAKRTAKSYQAAQHLFFDNVEKIFKLLGELNKQVKDFENKVDDHKIKELEEVDDLILNFNKERDRKNYLGKQIKIKEDDLVKLNKEKQEQDYKLKTLNGSEEQQNFLKLRDEQAQLEQKYKNAEYKIFSFFSKLQKALKKYERVALDDKIIKIYLEDSTTAFLEDSELKILSVLQGLKKNLDNLQFDDKQKSNFLELIEKNNLKELHESIKKLELQKEELNQRLNKATIVGEINKVENETRNINYKIEKSKLANDELKTKLEKIDLENNNKRFTEKVKEVFNVEVKIV